MKPKESAKSKIRKRFEEKVMPAIDGCWYWTAGVGHFGYGRFNVNNVNELSHRMAYKLYKGKIRKGLFVCHSCDNPLCVNPDHLFIGTAKDNYYDMLRKGRRKIASGIDAALSKLTDEKVIKIRREFGKLTKTELGKKYGISRPSVSDVINRVTWKHVQ